MDRRPPTNTESEPMSGSTVLARVIIFMIILPALLVYVAKLFLE